VFEIERRLKKQAVKVLNSRYCHMIPVFHFGCAVAESTAAADATIQLHIKLLLFAKAVEVGEQARTGDSSGILFRTLNRVVRALAAVALQAAKVFCDCWLSSQRVYRVSVAEVIGPALRGQEA
jgi:hypothetical protein